MKKAIIMLIVLCITGFAQNPTGEGPAGKVKIAVCDHNDYNGDSKEFSKAVLTSLVKNCEDCQEITNYDAFFAYSKENGCETAAKKYGADLFLWLFVHPYENSTIYLIDLKKNKRIIDNGSIKLQGYSSNSVKTLVAGIQRHIINAALGVQNQRAKEQEDKRMAKEKQQAERLAMELENKRRELIKSLWE